jgi:hypothetical protein
MNSTVDESIIETRSQSQKSLFPAKPKVRRDRIVDPAAMANSTLPQTDHAFLSRFNAVVVRRPTREPRPMNPIGPPVLTIATLQELALRGKAEIEAGLGRPWREVKAELGL